MTSERTDSGFGLVRAVALCAGLCAAVMGGWVGAHALAADTTQTGPDPDALRVAGEDAAAGAAGGTPTEAMSEEAAEQIRFARSLSGAFEHAAEIIEPSVVNITTRAQVRMPGRTALVDSGVGSGVIVSESGYVLTNNHVIAEAVDAMVRLSDGREYDATLIGRDALRDLALLRIDADDLTPATFADSNEVRVGEWVLAVGSPFGFSSTVTAGIVSAKGRGLGIAGRESAAFEDFIQTDAAINRGNSGGPLINLEGQVVGINSAIFSPSGGSVGIGFSIPSHLVQAVYDRLREGGTVGRGWVGVDLASVDERTARRAGLERAAGVQIAGVLMDGPAERSGLRAGDIVVSFNGRRIEDLAGFQAAIGIAAPSSVARLEVVREGRRVPLDLTIGDYDLLAALAASQVDEAGRPVADQSAATALLNLYGVRFDAPTEAQQKLLDDAGLTGLLVSDAASSGGGRVSLRRGDLVIQINGQPVTGGADAIAALAEGAKEGRGVLVRAYRESIDRLFEAYLTPVQAGNR
ncbi:MAG: trypsin-like peptidase domain-containing protein [Phycisphaerales bacterium]